MSENEKYTIEEINRKAFELVGALKSLLDIGLKNVYERTEKELKIKVDKFYSELQNY